MEESSSSSDEENVVACCCNCGKDNVGYECDYCGIPCCDEKCLQTCGQEHLSVCQEIHDVGISFSKKEKDTIRNEGTPLMKQIPSPYPGNARYKKMFEEFAKENVILYGISKKQLGKVSRYLRSMFSTPVAVMKTEEPGGAIVIVRDSMYDLPPNSKYDDTTIVRFERFYKKALDRLVKKDPHTQEPAYKNYMVLARNKGSL